MKIYYSSNDALNEILVAHGISLTCTEKMDIVISDEDAGRIPAIVEEFAPAAAEDYSLEDPTYDVQFDDDTACDRKGFAESLRYCWDYIIAYNGTDESYFADYKGGVVSIICNETGETVYCEEVRDSRYYPTHGAALAAATAYRDAFGGEVIDGLTGEATTDDGRIAGAYKGVCVTFGGTEEDPLGENWVEFPYDYVDYE